MSANQLFFGISIILTGLSAGLFYSYQCSVINGLGRLGDREYLLAFQGINKAILNPVFFLSFMGCMVAMAITAFLAYLAANAATLPYLIAALAVYTIGVFGITAACNVPLNEAVATFHIPSASDSQLHAMRSHFEPNWNRWHIVRTVAAIASFILLIIPLIRRA
jgi:uncharacterized membrane protein